MEQNGPKICFTTKPVRECATLLDDDSGYGADDEGSQEEGEHVVDEGLAFHWVHISRLRRKPWRILPTLMTYRYEERDYIWVEVC